MGDNVKRIEEAGFFECVALGYARLSKTLEFVGVGAFGCCESSEALFLPSTLKSIKDGALCDFRGSIRLLILQHDIDLCNIGKEIICATNRR